MESQCTLKERALFLLFIAAFSVNDTIYDNVQCGQL